MMKKDLVASMLLILFCSFSITCFTRNLPDEKYCLVDFIDTIKTCVLQNFDSFVSLKGQKVLTSSACCGVIKEFKEACASRNFVSESEMSFFRWVMDSCGTVASPISALPPTPTSSSSSPPSNSSTTPTTPGFEDLPSWNFEPPAIQLPSAEGSSAPGGCSLGLATKCWPGILNNGSDVCCSLERFKGINCATGLTGEPFDKVREMCCVDCKWQDHVKYFKVNPHYLGSLSVPSPPTAPATPASGDLPSWNFEPPAIQLPKLIDMSSGCRTGSATKCWSGILNNGSDVCCFLQRFQGCETGELKGEPFDRVREMCCADCKWQEHIKFFKVNPQYLDSLG